MSHWSSLFRPENDADGCEVFEVTNHRSPRAIMEQCDLCLLARGAAPFLQFLRYILWLQSCWVVDFQNVRLLAWDVSFWASFVCVCVCFCVWCMQANPAYADCLNHTSGLWANSNLVGQGCKVNSYTRRISSSHASESCKLVNRFSPQHHSDTGNNELVFQQSVKNICMYVK